MSSVRAGNQPVLLVVDVQAGVMARTWNTPTVVGRIAHAVQRAREAGVPVLWVQHMDADLPKDSAVWQLVPELVPAPGEARIDKRYESSFEDTALEAELAARQATHIVLAGAASNWCIRATAYGALDRGYDLTLLADAHTAPPMELAPGRRVEAQSIIDDLNTVMTWISYPGRRAGTASADTVDFFSVGGQRG